MNFKNLRIYCVLYLIVIGFVCGKIIVDNFKEKFNQNSEFEEHSQETDLDQLKLNELELPDKVYTFFLGSYSLIFEDIYLDEDYMYYIHIELVTPHNVTNMDISIWDPDGKKFHVFESMMLYELDFAKYFDIPYGTVMSGHYTFRFDSIADQNYNLYIRIEQGPKCLHDKIESPENIISQDGSRFYYDKSIHHIKNLETDISYIIYIGRVSAIAIIENSIVRLDCTIYDPNDVPFIIYENELLAPVDSVNKFNFGTAISGEYDVKIRIRCNVEYVNVAYAICKDFEISEVKNENDTKAPAASPSILEETVEEVKNSIPLEWLIGITVFIGVVVAVPCAALIKTKRRSAPEIGIKK